MAKAYNLGLISVKKFVFTFWIIFVFPLNTGADIIYFKDGMKTVCHDKAWEEDGKIKCEYEGTILIYQKKDVLRIQKVKIEKKTDSPMPAKQKPPKATAKKLVHSGNIKKPDPSGKPALQKASESLSKNKSQPAAGGQEFYNPRRPQKYWTGASSKHNTFQEAIASLAKQYDRSPEWIQQHMGETNDLDEIHRNLKSSQTNAPSQAQISSKEKPPEILFYNPRRPLKYWTSQNAQHKTFKEAISALARQYNRSDEWVQQHMGNTNNLSEIHQNLASSQLAESSQSN